MNIETLAGVVVAPEAAFDYQGVAILLGAITVFITGIVTSILTILTFNRQGARDRLLQQTHDLVDGVSSRLEAANKKADFAEGKEAGFDKAQAASAATPQPMVISEIAPAAVSAVKDAMAAPTFKGGGE